MDDSLKILFIFNLVLTHCQVNEIAAVLYILVTESFLFDVMAVKAFAPILKEEIFEDIKRVFFIQDKFFISVSSNVGISKTSQL